MHTRIRTRAIGLAVLAMTLGVAACSLNVTDPNSASEDKVLESPEAIQALAVGLQQYYANNVLGTLYINTGVTSRELTINNTFLGQVAIEAGGDQLDGSVGELATIFGNEMEILRTSELLLQQTPQLPFDPGTRSGILALAHLYSARAIGDLTTVFEQVPVHTEPDENATFHSRSEALTAAIAHLDSAAKILADTAPSPLFNSKIKSSRLDLINTINAYRARYYLFNGDWDAAIDASNEVDPAASSFFSYDAQNLNPIFSSLVQSRSYAARDGLGTPLTEAGDKRVAFFLTADSAVSNPKDYPIDLLSGFFAAGNSPIPAYIPGEMMLIRAEAYVRLHRLPDAVGEINAVRTKTAAEDPLGLGADLSPYAGAINEDALLTEIYRQRTAELYLQGLRLEDSRRLGRPGPPASMVERNRDYYPYPDQERRNNPNTPPNPAN
jgi:starch-binding outer membrane protein, SusD/RagB family